MKFFAVILSAAAVSASTIFNISNFSASCIAHSTQCSYSFGVIQPGTVETTPVQCKAMVAAGTDGTLPDVQEGTCEGSSRTFKVVRSADGLTLTVSQPITPSTNQAGSHLIANSELVTSNEPNAIIQVYKGPTAFTLDS